MDYQHDIEKKMYEYVSTHGGKHPLAAPAQRMKDFCRGIVSKDLPKTSYHPGAWSSPLHELLPEHVSLRLRRAFPQVDRQMHGYYTNDALLLGVESRTSSPVRLPRRSNTWTFPACIPAGKVPVTPAASFLPPWTASIARRRYDPYQRNLEDRSCRVLQ